MRYHIYMRASTEDQRKRKNKEQEEDGLGFQAQLKDCMDWAQKNGEGEILVYQDVITGTDKKEEVLVIDDLDKRVGLQEALRELKKGDIFLVSKRDRLGRDPFIMAMIERIIKKKKAIFVCADGSMEDTSPNGMLLRHMIDGFAKYEAMMISSRTKAALGARKARGERIGHVPYGHRLDSHGRLETCPTEAETLRAMYTYRVHDKLSFRAIAERLNESGYRNRDGGIWTHGATSRVYINYEKLFSDVRASLGAA